MKFEVNLGPPWPQVALGAEMRYLIHHGLWSTNQDYDAGGRLRLGSWAVG